MVQSSQAWAFQAQAKTSQSPCCRPFSGQDVLGLENVFGLSIASALVEAGGSALMSSFVGAFQAWA